MHMTPSHQPHSLARRPRLFCAVVMSLLTLLWGTCAAQSNDDRSSGGLFSAPGYPSSSSGMDPTQQGLGGGYGSGSTGNQGSSGGGLRGQTGGNGYNLQMPGTPSLRSPQNAMQQDQANVERQLRRTDLSPPKPSEFQKFVEASTGRMLPVFGWRFFADTQNGFAPVDNVPVPADYSVGPGDEVIVRAWGSIDVDYRSTVDRNGLLNLPKIGSFSVAGVKASQLESHLRTQIGRLYTNFNLSVTLGGLRSVKVFVVGPAQRPGVYTLSSQSTLLSAVVAAGGPGTSGSMRKISLRRDGRVISELDVYDFLVLGDKSKDMQLAGGDVVVFQPVGPRVAINGAIDNQAIYELKSNDEPLGNVLGYAGGAPVLANPNQAQLERVNPMQPKGARSVELFKLDAAGLQQPMHDGDVLTLLDISPRFSNAVTLKGHVAQPLRYAYTPGMRISDLIPDRDALISPDFYRRKNLLVQMIDDDDDSAPSAGANDAASGLALNGTGLNGTGNTNANTNANTNTSTNTNTNGNTGRANVTGALSSNAGRSDTTTRQNGISNRSRAIRAEDRELIGRARKTPVPLFDELNWEYAIIERLNPSDLTTQVIPFNLGAVVLRGDPTQNVELKPGDVVTIYSQKDIKGPVAKQTRLVSIEGEIAAPGVYQLLPGETLRGLIARAGGFTPQAYVYGLEFTREEARQRQQENLTAAIARLQTLAATQAARDAANRRDDTSAAATSAVSDAATQAQLTRLRAMQPNGRIALELNPQDKTLAQLPDFPLDNADRILVPPRPGFVTVAGAVANGNAFLWKPGRTVADYLKIAGVDEAAEIDNTFVLRADGTVASTGERRSVFGSGSVLSATLEPGDAVIVPNQLDFETWGRALVRNLKDWSQIFSQFGLGIAAIHSLNK